MAASGGSSRVPKDVSEPVKKEMLKPLIFGNHQKLFKLFTFIVSAGITYYFVFKHDFGDKRHCFSWIREYSEEKKRQFFSISPDDEILKRQKIYKTDSNNIR